VHGLENLSLEELFGVNKSTIRELRKENNVKIDSYDKEAFENLSKASAEFQQLVNSKDSPTWPALLRDIWASYYKVAPELLPQEQINPAYKMNRAWVEKMMEDPNTQQTRVNSMMDELVAGLATVEAGRQLAREIKDRPKVKETVDKADQAAHNQRKADEARAEGLEDLARNLEQQANQLMAEVEQDIKNNCRDIRRAIRSSLEKGREGAEKVVTAMGGWGIKPGDLTTVPLDQRISLTRRMAHNSRLKMLADLVGKMRNLARAKQKEKIKRDRDETHGITLGSDLSHILPVELAAIKNPLRKKDFYRRYTEKQLLQYELKVKEKQGRGPIICAVDISGSMGGQPLDWATAVALALVDTAARQKRQSAVIFFDTQVKKVIEFKPGERDLNKYADMASTGAAGGTAFDPPLNWATDKITDIAFKRADVVMVTDGLCYLDNGFLDAFKAKKEALKFNCWTVLIGSDPGGELKKWSDRVWAVNRLDEETAGEIFQEVY